ncbi:MAG TPA: PAS domain S-box protein, partial [Dehalococcoidales bacterium]|nr:PAS domain S-box protein [Dehalococcoidales bacterium]
SEEIQSRIKSGETYTVLFSAELINIGGEQCILSSSTDVTERKNIEEALRESEEKFSKAFRASPQAIAIARVKDGKFIEANESHSRVAGFTREELIGHTSAELNTWVNPEDRDRVMQILKKKGLIYNEELKFRKKSGEIQTILFSAELIYVGGEECIISSSTDVTKRKKMEEALRESEEKFSKAFRASPQAIAIARLSDGTFMEVNDSFTRISGYTREETIGHTSFELGTWAKPGDRDKMLKLLKEQGGVNNEEYLFRTKSGDIRTMLFSAEQMEHKGELCTVSVINDITEYRKIEEQAREAENLRELDRLRTELLANISHELRTPLASIKGFATMLLDYEDRLKRPEKREYLETINKNTDRLVELIEQLLEMSRLEAGMLSINKKPTNILRLCREVINEVRVRSFDHQYTLDIPARLPGVSVDGARIRQVLDNIIDNSMKYSDAGTEVNLAVRRKGPELIFTVTDHGIGIPQTDLPYVFDRMFHSPTKPGVAGAGLGLCICKGLVEAHGGKIWIESEEGKGTRCFFTLPLDTGERDRNDKKA